MNHLFKEERNATVDVQAIWSKISRVRWTFNGMTKKLSHFNLKKKKSEDDLCGIADIYV